MSCLRSSAIAVMLNVDTKMDVPCRNPATGHANG